MLHTTNPSCPRPSAEGLHGGSTELDSPHRRQRLSARWAHPLWRYGEKHGAMAGEAHMGEKLSLENMEHLCGLLLKKMRFHGKNPRNMWISWAKMAQKKLISSLKMRISLAKRVNRCWLKKGRSNFKGFYRTDWGTQLELYGVNEKMENYWSMNLIDKRIENL